MPIFQLTDEMMFPPVELSEEDGLLAIGGDLSAERLLLAYSNSLFPWYNEGDPILWWSTDPRFVLFPDEIKISKSMRRVFNQKEFTITLDRCFKEVMTECGMPRRKQRGTWITPAMLDAYCELHRLGYAHSVESWKNGKLAGGLYGVSLGRIFFGESMFAKENNASKAAFITLVLKLRELGFLLIDSQVYTAHLESLGARDIPRYEYLQILSEALKFETIRGNWGRAIPL